MKRCTKCRKRKSLAEFFKRPGATDGRVSSCRTCMAASHKDWRRRNPATYLAANARWRAAHPEYRNDWNRRNPEKRRAYARSWKWKRDGYPEPTRGRPKRCECCGRPPGKKILALDHCHATGRFRGWLCFKCNTALGMIGDTLIAARHVVRYLTRRK